MITHYLKVAVRNLLKYKTQTIISILGLAVGFTCIALSIYWNHYEMSYDSFLKGSQHIYRVGRTIPSTNIKSFLTPEPLANYLKETYPEVESAFATVYPRQLEEAFINGIQLSKNTTHTPISPEGIDVLEFEWIEGNKNMDSWKDTDIAISQKIAKLTCGDVSPIGQKMIVRGGKEVEIVGVFKDWPKHSNFRFDIISKLNVGNNWASHAFRTFAKLHPNTNYPVFMQNIRQDTIIGNNGAAPCVFDEWTPLTTMRYNHPENQPNIRFEDVRLFTIASVLLAFCALLNYLTLFINRIRSKGRNLALRTIYGSSNWQLSKLLMSEYLLLLTGSLLISLLFIEITSSAFMELAQIKISRFELYLSCTYFIAFVIALATVLSFVPIYYFKKNTLQKQLVPNQSRISKNIFSLTSICFQLAISILFIFCSTMMMKQIYSLLHSDMNINRKQIAWVLMFKDNDRALDLLKQMPEIKEVLFLRTPLYPVGSGYTYSRTNNWEGKSEYDNEVDYEMISITPEICNFYGLKIKEGTSSFDLGNNEVFINEALAKAMNMNNPVGKMLDETYRIKGVIHDFQNRPPTQPIEPTCFFPQDKNSPNLYIAFKYTGDYESCKKNIVETLTKEGFQYFSLQDGEQLLQKCLKSEYNLLKLLGIVTLVSILIALFGIYAMIVQTCEKHRKEIAIRKVNGAHVTDILFMFIKQYMTQVIIASIIAFPIGYILIKQWLENYSRQTEISLWIFIGIFIAISALVTLCIGHRVWKVANENPAEVVKSE